MKDISGVEKCFKEWESGCIIMYDIRIVNVFIGVYIKDGLFEKV